MKINHFSPVDIGMLIEDEFSPSSDGALLRNTGKTWDARVSRPDAEELAKALLLEIKEEAGSVTVTRRTETGKIHRQVRAHDEVQDVAFCRAVSDLYFMSLQPD